MRMVVLAALALLSGCKSSPEHTTKPQAPVKAAWVEVARDGTKAELIARIQRLAPLAFPLEVTLQVPEGATLVAGRAHFNLAPNAEAVTNDEPVTVTYEKTPELDLLLLADGAAPDMGIHMRSPYRFGRPEPLQPVVAPRGPDLKVGDRNLGPSVPISPQ